MSLLSGFSSQISPGQQARSLAFLSMPILIACWGNVASQATSSKVGWIKFHATESSRCSISASFPGHPTTQESAVANGGKMLSYSVAGSGGSVFRVVCTVAPDSMSTKGKESGILSGSRDEAVRSMSGHLIDDRELSIAGLPGRKFTVAWTSNGVPVLFYAELAVAEHTLFSMTATIAAAAKTHDSRLDVDHFFDSIAIDGR